MVQMVLSKLGMDGTGGLLKLGMNGSGGIIKARIGWYRWFYQSQDCVVQMVVSKLGLDGTGTGVHGDLEI